MRPTEEIEKLLKNTNIDTNGKTDNAVLDDIVKAFEKPKQTKSVLIEPNIWRIIMKSNITKLAAAAVIIMGVTIGFHWFDAAKAYGITEALELWRNAEIIHIKGWQYLHTGDDTQLEKFPFESWFDKKNGLLRDWHPVGWFGDYTTETPQYYLTVSDGQFIMETSCYTSFDDNKVHPVVSFTKMSSFQQRLWIHTMEPLPAYISNLDRVKGFTKIGKEMIKDRLADVWEGEITSAGKIIPFIKQKIWLSPETGEIIRIFIWRNAEENSIRWVSGMDVNTIEYNVIPPSDSFKTDPPEGYELRNTKETVIEKELGEDGGVRFYGCIGFTLKEGSVVFGWHANHLPEESQAHLFANLEQGGPLPELPAQIVGLKPWPVEGDITYLGYHLAYTQKKGKFYEWSIYVPDKNIPERSTFQDYKIISKYNGVEPRRFGGRPNLIGQELVINTEREFNNWVLGAMAELSDDSKAPEYVIYEDVLQLAKRIRKSLNK